MDEAEFRARVSAVTLIVLALLIAAPSLIAANYLSGDAANVVTVINIEWRAGSRDLRSP